LLAEVTASLTLAAMHINIVIIWEKHEVKNSDTESRQESEKQTADQQTV
jgi:hypothetical protein